MFYQKKYERAMQWLREKNSKGIGDLDSDESIELDSHIQDHPDAFEEEWYVRPTDEKQYQEDLRRIEEEKEKAKEELYRINNTSYRKNKRKKDMVSWHEEDNDKIDLEKHDMFALLFSSFIIFIPVIVLMLGLFVLVAWIMFF